MKNNLLQKNIPKGWNVIKLGNPNVAIINPEQIDPQKQEDDIFQYIDIGAINNNKILEAKQFFGKDSPSRARRLVKEGDVIVSTVRPNLKAVAFISKKYSDSLVSTGFCVLRGNTDYVDKNFIYQTVLASEFTDFLVSKTKGSNYPAVSSHDIEDYDMRVPPIQEQKKIAMILSSLDEDIQKVDEIILKTEELKKGLMAELFIKGIGHIKFKKTEIGTIPAVWGIGTLEEVTEKISVGFVGTCEPFYTNESGVPMIRTGNLKISGIDINDLKYVTNEFHKKNIKSQIKSNDILIARHGENGLACLVPNNFGEANCLNVVIVRPNLNVLNPIYLFYAINAPIVRSQIEAKTGGSTQKVVNTSSIKLVRLGIPDQEEQNEITKVLVSVDKKIELNKKLKEKLTQLKNGLMVDLLSGKVRVNKYGSSM